MINKHIQLGKINTLKIERITQPGLYLKAQDDEVVLLPNIYITPKMKVEDVIDVFIYTDSDDRLVATTLKPLAMLGDYVALEVVDIVKYGSFLDWGLPKDLFIPKNHQKSIFNIGDIKIVKILEDEKTSRLYATEKISKYLSKDLRLLKKYQLVNIMILSKTPLGYKVLVDNLYEGLIFNNEIFQSLLIGQKINGYIKNIRSDKKLDISLQPIGKKSSRDFYCEKILKVLQDNHGKIKFNYKSDAQDINNTFQMSKKVFKATLTELINNKTVILEKEMLILLS